MKTFRLCLSFAVLSALVGMSPAVAHADTYQIFSLGSGDRISVVGITASGVAVLVYNVPSGAPECAVSHVCHLYDTWVNGVMVNSSAIAPNLVYDNGSPCTISASFLSFPVSGVCNNGHEVYSDGPAPISPYNLDTFTGPDPVTDLFRSGPIQISDVHLNGSGDFVFNIHHAAGDGGLYAEAIDLTTDAPEPSSMVLLGTGVLALAGTLRRRLACSH